MIIYVYDDGEFWTQILALPFISCVTLGKLLDISEFQFFNP